MKKVLIILCLVGIMFGAKAVNWKVSNDTIKGAKAITAPYRDSFLYVENLASTVVTVDLKDGKSVIPAQSARDYFPLSFYYGETVTINTVASQDVTVIWYEAND